MSLAQTCPHCGTALPDEAPEGALCAACAEAEAMLRTVRDEPPAADAGRSTTRGPQAVGEFEVLGKLGQGGMGAVYRARQVSLDRVVALKILPGQFGEDPEYVARFQREARVAASINHQNLVRVYSSGEADGCHYIAMELVEGENLHQRLKRGPLDPAEALRIGLGVAHGLQCGWERAQLIHRDIKPSNIYLSTTGDVKLGDLGLAKSLLGNTTGLTQTGAMMGTPHYISPEQARGDKALDFRADIYSLGCTLYECLTGRTPYEATDAFSVMNMHVNAAPPTILKVMPHCPVPLGRLVSRMLKKLPRERAASYEELIAELERVLAFLEGGGIDHGAAARVAAWKGLADGTAPVAPRPTAAASVPAGKSRLPLYAGIGVAALAVVLALVFAMGGKKKPAPIAKAAPSPAAAPPPARTATPPAPAPAAPRRSSSTEPWTDALAQWWADPAKVRTGSLVKEAGGSRIVAPTGFFTAVGKFRDGAVRVTARSEDPRGWQLMLRSTVENGARTTYFAKPREAGGRGILRFEKGGKLTTLRDWVPPPGFSYKDSHTFELRTQGDVFTCTLDGQEVASVKDISFPAAGSAVFQAFDGVLIEKLEYLNLDAPPAAAAAAPALWQDGLARFWAVPGNATSGRLAKEPGGSRVLDNAPALGLGVHQDVAVRATVRGDTGKRWGIELRYAGEGAEQRTYKTEITDKEWFIYRVSPGAAKHLAGSKPPAGFSVADRHTLEVRLQGDALSWAVDGQPLATVTDSVIAGQGRTYFYSDNGVLIEKLEFQNLDGVKVAPALVAPAGDGPWTDLLAPVLAKGQLLSWWKQVGSGLQVDDRKGSSLDSKRRKDVAVRVTARCPAPSGRWEVTLRHPPTGSDNYGAELLATGRGRLLMNAAGKETILASFDMPAGFSLAESHTLEFRAQGDRLSVAVDGREMAAVHDSTHAEGRVLLLGSAGTIFEKVEVRDLGAP